MSSCLDVGHLLAPVTTWGRQQLSSCCAQEAGCCENRELRRKPCTQGAFGSIWRQVQSPSLAVRGLLLRNAAKTLQYPRESPTMKIKCEAGESGRRLTLEQGREVPAEWGVGGDA